MPTNGDRRSRKARLKFELAMELRLIDDARHTPLGIRTEALAWLRRWRRRPDRVFWEIEPTGGRKLV